MNSFVMATDWFQQWRRCSKFIKSERELGCTVPLDLQQQAAFAQMRFIMWLAIEQWEKASQHREF